MSEYIVDKDTSIIFSWQIQRIKQRRTLLDEIIFNVLRLKSILTMLREHVLNYTF